MYRVDYPLSHRAFQVTSVKSDEGAPASVPAAPGCSLVNVDLLLPPSAGV